VTDDLEQQIRAAYRDIATRPLEQVRLADIRARLNAPADEVDIVLRRMERQPDVRLTPADPNTRTNADREAAVLICCISHHLIAIEDR
jgi:hypothetical protein